MTVKRWTGRKGTGSDTAGNWLGVVVPVGQGSALAITAASYDRDTATITITAPGHELSATDSVRFAGFMGFWSVLNWTNPGNLLNLKVASVNGNDFTITNFDSILLTQAHGDLAAATVQFMGDDVQMLKDDMAYASTVNITAITKATKAVVTCGTHSYLAGDNVTIAGVAGMTQINGARTVDSVDATHVTLTVNSSAFSTYTSGGTVAPNPSYCQSAPAVSTTINSLVATTAHTWTSSPSTPSIYGTNGGNVKIASIFNLTEDEGIVSLQSGSPVGGYGSMPTLLSGCVGVWAGPPNWTSSPYRSLAVNVNSGATLTIKALAPNPNYALGSQGTGLHPNSVIGGHVVIDPASSAAYRLNGVLSAGAVLDVNVATNFLCSCSLIGPCTVNINTPLLWQIGGGTASLHGKNSVINANYPLAMTCLSLSEAIKSDLTINAKAPLTLANFTAAGAKAITITGITKAANAVVSGSFGWGDYPAGSTVTISGVQGMPEINGTQTVVASDAFTLTLAVNSTGFGTWTSGGTVNTPPATLTVNSYGYAVTEIDVSGTIVVNGVAPNAPLTRRRT